MKKESNAWMACVHKSLQSIQSEAMPNWSRGRLRKAGGCIEGCQVYCFTSKLPFAMSGHVLREDKAGCRVARDGVMSWIRCNRKTIA